MSASGTLNIRTVGAGQPALIFVHGFGCSLDDWDAQLAGLSGRFRCVALDLPGHGGSARPETISIEAMADAVNVAKRNTGADAAVLIGHSMGTKVIREAYCRSREGVAGLVLIDGSMYPGEREVLLQRARERIAGTNFDAFVQGMFQDMFVESTDPAQRERIVTRALQMDPEFGRALFLATVGWDPLRGEETLRQIDVPLLLLQATFFGSDFKRQPLRPGISTPFMELLSRLVAKSEVKAITGAGHFPMIDVPDVVNRHIEEFCTRLPLPR
jgi:pimeloyl-ACP methyl ester carboxylesterase